MKKSFGCLLSLLYFLLCSSGSYASPVLYIDDSAGRLATVDVSTGAVHIIGSMGVVMTDIAFDPQGNLYGLDFNNLYRIDPNTAARTLIGSHGISNGNALVFGTDGTLYAAGAGTTYLYTVNTATGAATALGNMGYSSAGDLAFNNGVFYLASSSNLLVSIDMMNNADGTEVGPFGYSNVFGLATADNGILYGVSGTTVFSVNPLTGQGAYLSSFAGQGVSGAYGSSFITEATVPVPAAIWLLGTAFLGLVGLRSRRKG